MLDESEDDKSSLMNNAILIKSFIAFSNTITRGFCIITVRPTTLVRVTLNR